MGTLLEIFNVPQLCQVHEEEGLIWLHASASPPPGKAEPLTLTHSQKVASLEATDSPSLWAPAALSPGIGSMKQVIPRLSSQPLLSQALGTRSRTALPSRIVGPLYSWKRANYWKGWICEASSGLQMAPAHS